MNDITQAVVHLRTLVDQKYLELTWDEIAEKVGLPSGEAARSRYRAAMEQYPEVDEVSPNNLVLNLLGTERIVSAKHLMEAHEINPEEWEIARQSIRKWDGYSKISHKDIKWADGRIQEGAIKEEGKLNVVELFYVRVELVRKKPILVEPVLQQIIMPEPDPPYDVSPTTHSGKQEMVVYIPDPHFPYEDPKALSLILKFVKRYRQWISTIIWGGDILDLRELSHFTDLETKPESLSEALQRAGDWLYQFRQAAPNANILYLEGNHEKRLRRILAQNLPALYGLHAYGSVTKWPLISIPNLLNLEKMRIRYIDGYPDEIYYYKDVGYVHGTLYGTNGAGLQKLLRDATYDTVAGHDHRIQMGSKRVYTSPTTSKIITVALSGWTGNQNNPPPGRSSRPDFHSGFTVVQYYGGFHRIEVIPLFDDYFMFGEEIFELSPKN